MQTLENLTQELRKQRVTDDEIPHRLHVASMLAIVEASTAVLNHTTMPTPLYRLTYDDQNSSVEFEELGGYAPVPEDGALDISMADLLMASLLRERMPLLFEGKTGTGKTHTTEQFLKTVLPSANYRVLRLNQNMTNVLQPYTEGTIENGLLKVKLRRDELGSVAALFIDEVNRGDTNQVLMLQDGIVTLGSGERGELGLPVPEFRGGRWEHGEHKRPTFVVSAQNPPSTKDAKYSGTRRADAAQSNRNLQVSVPNSASTIGASTLLLEYGNGQHGRFRDEYARRLASHLGLAQAPKIEDWADLYAFTTDPKKTECPNLRSSVEFMDAMLLMASPDLKGIFEQEKRTASDWHRRLQRYADFQYDAQLTETAAAVALVQDTVRSFQEEIVTRDSTRAKKLADMTSMIRRVKTALASDDPVATYQALPSYITVQDVACGFAVMLRDKQETHEKDPVKTIDQVLKDYTNIATQFADKVGYRKPFSADDAAMSVYSLAVSHACRTAAAAKQGERVPAIIKDLGASVAHLRRLDAGNELRKPVIARMIADLATLAGYADQYAKDLEPSLTADATRNWGALNTHYGGKRALVSTPHIYAHRLTRVLGV